MSQNPEWTEKRRRLAEDAMVRGLRIEPHSLGRWLVVTRSTNESFAGLGVGLTDEQLELVIRGTEEEQAPFLD
jgi:hypothetical protein